MPGYRAIDQSTLDFFAKIQRIAEKFEANLIASGRYVYLKTEGNRKIYIEQATGHEVPVLMPTWTKSKQAS
jgi:hypothetical protein